MKKRPARSVLAIATGALVLTIPWVSPTMYLVHLLNMMGINMILATSLNILLGYTGQISIGQAAFFGIGAYASAILTTRLGVVVWPAMLGGALAAALFGLLLGVPALKIRGHYLALVTIAFGEIAVAVFYKWEPVTGGYGGIVGIPAPSLASLELSEPRRYYYVVLAGVLLCLAATYRLIHSRLGRGLMAIREDEEIAGAMGVNVARLKVLSFTVSAFYAGLAGALHSHFIKYISPDFFTLDLSIAVLVMVVLGGAGHLWGPLFGAAVVTLLPEYLRFLQAYYKVVYGIGLIVIMALLPDGVVVSAARQFRLMLSARTHTTAAATRPEEEEARYGR